jgi:hypothetical protein
MMFANLEKLPLAAFQLRYVGEDPDALPDDRRAALGGSDSWLAQVEVTWRLSQFDLRSARETLPVTFVTRGGSAYAASFSERFAEGQRRPIWTLGRLEVAKGDNSLVIGLAGGPDPQDYAAVTDRAVTAVTRVWGENWRQRVVTYLPATQEQMEFLLGARPGGYVQIAAVTMAELDTPQAGAPVRIVANPKLFAELGRQGRRIVLTHETTHVASAATASPVPLWLAEGFADYVAFTAVPVQDESAAKELFKVIRAGKAPTALPRPGGVRRLVHGAGPGLRVELAGLPADQRTGGAEQTGEVLPHRARVEEPDRPGRRVPDRARHHRAAVRRGLAEVFEAARRCLTGPPSARRRTARRAGSHGRSAWAGDRLVRCDLGHHAVARDRRAGP